PPSFSTRSLHDALPISPDRCPPWDADGVRRVPAPGRGDLAGPRARRRIRRQRASPPDPRVPAIPTPRRGGRFRRPRRRADPRNLAGASEGPRLRDRVQSEPAAREGERASIRTRPSPTRGRGDRVRGLGHPAAAGLRIAYAPAALVPTFEGADRSACLEWCFRQMTMATLYLPVVRRYAAAAFSVIIGSILFGIACVAIAAFWGLPYLLPAALFFAPLPTAVAKASLRRRSLFSAAPSVAASWRVAGWRSAIASMAVPWVMAFGLVRTRRPTVLRWRGRTYNVTDPHHVRLLEGDPSGE